MTIKRHLPTLTYLFLGAFSVLISQFASGYFTSERSVVIDSHLSTDSPEATFIQIVRINSTLTEEGLIEKAQERAKEFRALPGLIQKYYIKLSDEGDYGGIYIWDSKESFLEYKASDLASTIGEAYKVTAPPTVDLANVLFLLRE